MSDLEAKLGAENLLRNCAGARAGDRLLIARETADYGFFDDEAALCVAAVAQDLGLSVNVIDVGFAPDTPHLSYGLLQSFEAADIVVFMARLGDQLRFSEMPSGKTIVVSYAIDMDLLGSGFGTADHRAFARIKKLLGETFAAADAVRLTCPAGTEVTGRPEMDLGPRGDTSILRFPMSVFTPVPARTFSGRVSLPGFLTGTGSRYYDDYTAEFDGPLFAILQDGRLAGFEGAAAALADAHYDRVAARFGIDRNAVHSWHAGMHPGCGFPWSISDSFERWGGAAFGNPRILHFHTCGDYAPGEISWNVIDPTVEIDGVAVWQDGVFHVDRLPGGAEILAAYPDAAALFASPDRQIGLVPPWQRTEPVAARARRLV